MESVPRLSGFLSRAVRTFSTAKFIRSPMLNIVGLHVFRVALFNVIYFLRKRGGVRHPLARRLASDGYVLVPNFLAPIEFARLKAAADAGWSQYASNVDHGRWGTTTLDNLSVDAAVPLLKRVVEETVWRHPDFVQLVSEIEYAATLERLSVPGDHTARCYLERVCHGGDGSDEQQQVHVDIFYPALQVFLYLEEVNEGDGPFSYFPRTHRVTPLRLAFEYVMSVRAPQNAGWRMPDWLRGFLKSRETLCVAPANTLVVANSQGFHARGKAAPGRTRYSLRFGFRNSPLGALLKVG